MKLSRHALAATAFIAVGWALRIREFLLGRSLSWFEAALAINILRKPLWALVGPLENHESAPLGFLLLSRLAVFLFGDGERALRLVPLLCGLAALPLVYVFAKRYLSPWVAVACVAFFALSKTGILWASLYKTYSMDVVVALLLMGLADQLVDAQPATRWMAAAAGAVGVWCSLPAVFVLTGIWLAAAIRITHARAFRRFAGLAATGAIWAASFAVYFVVSLRRQEVDPFLQHLWGDYFLSLRDLPQTRYLLAMTFIDPLDVVVGSAWPMLPTVVAGCLWLWRRVDWRSAEIVLPLVCVAIASFAHLYPWSDRLLLFATPLLVVLLFGGAAQFGQWAGRLHRSAAPVITAGLIGWMTARAALHLLETPIVEDQVRPLVAHISQHLEPGDRVYVGEFRAVYDYYRSRFGLDTVPSVAGPYFDTDPPADCGSVREVRDAPRVWALTNRDDVRTCLSELGAPAVVVHSIEASLYLYERR